MPDLAELIRRFHEADVARPDRPIRIIRVAHLKTSSWHQDAGMFTHPSGHAAISTTEASRCRTLAETGEHLGLERVGVVVETVEVTP